MFEVKDKLTANAVIAAAAIKIDLAKYLLRRELLVKKKLIRMHKTQNTKSMEGSRSIIPIDNVANMIPQFSAISEYNSFLLKLE